MNQLFRVTVGGSVVTEEVSNCNISFVMNRLYNVATFDSKIRLISESDITIEFGGRTFTGFIYSVLKKNEDAYAIVCRTNSAKMTEPYMSFGDSAIDAATTSHDLCALYASEYGTPITITAIDLDFGGDYERKGTAIGALTTIANVTGAEYWHDGTNIRIEPNKAIATDGTPIPASDIFDFVPMSDNIRNRGIRVITVGAVSDDTGTTTNISCTAEVDSCTGETMVRVIPHTAYQSADGICLEAVRTQMNYSGVMAEGLSLKLQADIVSISSITVAGVRVTDYTFLYDTILFTTAKRGIVSVDYIGYGLRGCAPIQYVNGERYSQFDVFYGECDVYQFQDKMECSDNPNPDGPTSSMCGGVYVTTPKTMNYVIGFNFQTIGGTPVFTFYSESRLLYANVETTYLTYDWVEHATLSIEADGTIRHKLRFTPVSLTEVRSNGTDITAHASLSGVYVVLDAVYNGVVVAYKVLGRNHYVQFDDQPDSQSIRMVVSGSEDGDCEYELEGLNIDRTSSTECVEGVTVAIDMIAELGVHPWQAVNKAVTVVYPDETSVSINTNNVGVLHIPDVQFGEYNFNVSNIKKNVKMTMLAGDTQ